MACPGTFSDEPLSPAGRLFLQQKTDVVIHCIARTKNPIDVDGAKATIMSSPMGQHPRFCSLLVRDDNGFEHWRKTRLDVDRHVIVVKHRVNEDEEDDEVAVNLYVADLSVSSPLSTDKPLWEVHLLTAHKHVVFRIHHSLGDGISLMSMLMASCRKVSDPDALPMMVPEKTTEKKRDSPWSFGSMWGFLKMAWLTFVFVLEFLLRSLFVSDRKTAVSGGDGVELWPRKLATAKFLLDDMKEVKKAIPDTTINDVLFGIVSCGLSRYLDHRTPNALHEGLRMTGVAMVNLRAKPGLQEISKLMKDNSETRWGNKFGYASLINYRLLCNTTFTISNLIGPLEDITLSGNPISSIKVSTSSLPQQALTMHMVSYAGKAEMQILVAKDIIPDPEFLAKCFEDALLEMKVAAMEANKA
ncbi:wax ester synthase/diacylglycerol acyltransferase 11-like isoform X3 [Gossypium arboreum]|uniref:wax ester synthase/diacylglycerol acyltransferase 11-like isoform X3 n=1 Tax=Gossypium arboreum TaxID=29729 RepID=UPI0022F18850|nr:wax ester synthase/diacylglycerol acyltransferase 11-like isoform X3 [Gossypium arboreum]